MTDEELARFIGIAVDSNWPAAVAAIAPEKRRQLERMAKVVDELNAYSRGEGPMPAGVIL